MKIKKIFYSKSIFLFTLTVVSILSSCSNDDKYFYYPYYSPSALVTIKNTTENTCYFQLDDNTTLLPVNIRKSLYEKPEVRAFVNYEYSDEPSGIYDESVYVNWIDTILTKPIAPNLGEDNLSVYGNDPVEIVKDWVTLVEDGYLTLLFETYWGNNNTYHFVNLVPTENPENPYELRFCHNAYGDTKGMPGQGIVAFDLNSLPDTNGETVKLKLIWESFSGEKSTEFDYCTRQTTVSMQPGTTSVRSVLPLK